MKVSDVFPSKYIKAADLQGRSHSVVISHSDIEQIGSDRKLVIYFQGRQKGLVTNKTNADRISFLYGQEIDDWQGREIVLYPELATFQGKTDFAVRVRAPEKKPESRAPQPVHPQAQQEPPVRADFDEEIPF